MMGKLLLSLLIAISFYGFETSAEADTSVNKTSSEDVGDLKDRVQSLEQENKALQRQVEILRDNARD